MHGPTLGFKVSASPEGAHFCWGAAMSRTLESKDSWLAALREEGVTFRAAISQAEPTAPVPSCPGWNVRDLVNHLGGVYDWVFHHVGRGVVAPPERGEYAPPEGAEVVAWWDERFAALVELLDRLDPELPAWNWASQAKVV